MKRHYFFLLVFTALWSSASTWTSPDKQLKASFSLVDTRPTYFLMAVTDTVIRPRWAINSIGGDSIRALKYCARTPFPLQKTGRPFGEKRIVFTMNISNIVSSCTK